MLLSQLWLLILFKFLHHSLQTVVESPSVPIVKYPLWFISDVSDTRLVLVVEVEGPTAGVAAVTQADLGIHCM